MNSTGTPETPKPSIKLWVILGVVFMFLLAASSAIDASFFYISLGGAAFCVFMALRGWLSTKPWKNQNAGYQQQPPQGGFSFDFNFNKASDKGQQHRTARPTQPTASVDVNAVAKRMFRIFAMIFASIFGMVILVSIFGEPDHESEIQYYTSQADLFLGNSEFDSARANYRRVLRLRPDDITARIGYGKTFYFQEQYDSAIIMFNGVNELEPENSEAKLFRGRTYYYRKSYPEALSEAEGLLVNEPGHTEAMLLAGDIHYTQKNYDEALSYYEPAYENGARTRDLCWIMAWIYDEKKDIAKAIPLYKEAVTYDDTLIDVYTRLSQITQEPEAGEYRKKVAELNGQ